MKNKKHKRLIIRSILQVLSVIWKFYAAIILIITLIIFYPVYAILLLNKRTLKTGFQVIRFHSWLILVLIGVRARVKYQGTLPEGPFIICPNHTSYLDIILMYQVFKKYFVFIGKRELESDRIFGIFFKKMNILVKRDSAMDGMRALNMAAKMLKEGTSVVIFPEGTIPEHAPDLMPFKNGPFRLAIKEHIPIVPVTFLNVFKLLQIGAFFKRRGKPGMARIIVNETIYTDSLNQEDLNDLREKVYDSINLTIQEHFGKR